VFGVLYSAGLGVADGDSGEILFAVAEVMVLLQGFANWLCYGIPSSTTFLPSPSFLQLRSFIFSP
jgi:hypothetical protein